jgi:glutamyl-tRNA synthetase
VRLGWSYKDQEIFTMQEMIEHFNLESVNSSSAVFDTNKLDWLNGHYIRAAKPEDLEPEVRRFLEMRGAKNIAEAKLLRAIKAGQEKVKTLVEMTDFIELIFKDVPIEEAAIAKAVNDAARPVLQRVVEELEKLPTLTRDTIHSVFEKIMAEFSVGLGKVANPVRVALSGKQISPGAYDLIELFGKEESLKRLRRYL